MRATPLVPPRRVLPGARSTAGGVVRGFACYVHDRYAGWGMERERR